MKQGVLSFFGVRRVADSPAFAYCAAFLLCGLLAGSFTGMHIPQREDAYMNMLADLLAGDPQPLSVGTVLSCTGFTMVWSAAALAFGALRGRELWIALIVAVRGFLMAFSVAASVIRFGAIGCLLSALTTGAAALLSVPALLIVSASAIMAGRHRGWYLSTLKRCSGALCFAALLLMLAAAWRLLVPELLAVLPNKLLESAHS